MLYLSAPPSGLSHTSKIGIHLFSAPPGCLDLDILAVANYEKQKQPDLASGLRPDAQIMANMQRSTDVIDAALREDGRWEQVLLLGKGSFGCVCQARCVATGEVVAIKILPRTEVGTGAVAVLQGTQQQQQQQQYLSTALLAPTLWTQTHTLSLPLSVMQVNKYVQTEIVNHSLMRHPHIIQFKDVFMTSQFICIVLEYAGTGTLHAYVRRYGHLKEAVARWFFQQLAVAVDYCHRRGVANRDIKLENTLLHVGDSVLLGVG